MREYTYRPVTIMVLCVVLTAGLLTSPTAGQTVRQGDVFPSFAEPDVRTEKTIELESLRGKVVLVDFWAMWCVPCLGEIPNLKNVYDRYHEQGFEIVSISLDRNARLCKQFIGNRKMRWHHICDGKGWDAKLAKKHHITAIPRSFLLDATGKVIATDLRGDALKVAVRDALASVTDANVDDVMEKEGRKGLTQADGLRDEEKYDEALDLYEELSVKYSSRPSGKLANERARLLLDDPRIVEKIRQAREHHRQDRIEAHGRRWLALARKMVEGRKYRLARYCYQRVIDKYPESSAAATARDELESLPT